MSQQRDAYPPPPSQSSGAFMQSRRLQSGQPPLITTVFNRSQASQPSTPLPGSAISTPLSPMFSPTHANFSNVSSPMASGTYNPRQWSQSGHAESSRAASSSSLRTSTRDATGMEISMPSPPPPYTPPTPGSSLRPIRPVLINDNNDLYVASPLPGPLPSAGPSSSRSSPQMHMAPHFPPPPSKGKSSVRTDRDPSKSRFSLSALTAIVKRPDYAEGPSQPQSPMLAPVDAPLRPPAGRRAISAGGISLPSASGGSSYVGSRRTSPESSGWEPGMPLPPPPPGPPPSTGRSHSLNRYAQPQPPSDISTEGTNSSRHTTSVRNPRTNTLGTIPPTPVGWVDEDPIPQISSTTPSPPTLRADVNVRQTAGPNLARRPVTRDHSADSILERRSKSRAGRETPVDAIHRSDSHPIPTQASTFPKPAKLVLSSTDPLFQRRMAERTEKAEQSGSQPGSANKKSPEATRLQNAKLSVATLTPPYTPAARLQSDKVKRTVSDSPATASTAPSSDAFMQSSLERFHMFIQQEASSPSDRDRLGIFAKFMVQESRIRRDLYAVAFNSMAGEIMDMTRDLWRPSSSTGVVSERRPVGDEVDDALPRAMRISASPEGSRKSGNVHAESTCSSATEFTPATDTESICDNSEDRGDDKPPPSTPWGERFQPSLSPIRSIPSMAVSTVPDEEDSRGRSASRWWEGSNEGSGGQGGRKLEMTKEESKYMSLHPHEFIMAAQPSPDHTTPTPRTAQTTFLSRADKYPSEKVGLHEEESSNESHPPSQPVYSPQSGQGSRGKGLIQPSLDVSRLVTLPPPYPRHYPALHNNHPSLSAIRSRHREFASAISTRQNAPTSDPSWQPNFFSSMLQKCEFSIYELTNRLNRTSDSDPSTAAQTEGDERPELLEELTLLKWIFEAREQLQKQDFDAQMQQLHARSQAFTNHCQATGEYQRKADEEARLAHHLLHSQLAYAEQASARFSQLLEIVEHHVNRGVEVQLSAFWDIAPALLEIVQKIPAKDAYGLANLAVLIPSAEVADNPSYRRFPLQYLLATLNHAKKSAYQFIESQTNLLCLLHEVRTAAVSAEVRLMGFRRCVRVEDQDVVREEMGELRKMREDEETRVLKERVGVLEGQWGVALGEEIEVVIEKVEEFLKEVGGWDEGMGE